MLCADTEEPKERYLAYVSKHVNVFNKMLTSKARAVVAGRCGGDVDLREFGDM